MAPEPAFPAFAAGSAAGSARHPFGGQAAKQGSCRTTKPRLHVGLRHWHRGSSRSPQRGEHKPVSYLVTRESVRDERSSDEGTRRHRRHRPIPSTTGDRRAFRCVQPAKASWRTKWTRSLILMKDYRNRKPFAITLDTVYMDNCGTGINIRYIINLEFCRQVEMSHPPIPPLLSHKSGYGQIVG